MAVGQSGTQETCLRLLSAFEMKYPGTPAIAGVLAAAVQEASKGSLRIAIHGPDEVPPFEQFTPVSQGAFDLLFSVQPYHIAITSASMGLSAMEPDPVRWRQAGIFDHVDQAYRRHDIKLLAIVPTTSPGIGSYQALLKRPVEPGDKPLAGRKIRGTPAHVPLVEAMGGTLVSLATPEIRGGLECGDAEGVFWPVIGAIDYGWYEVAPYMLRPTFGSAIHLLMMNLHSFESLAPNHRDILVFEAEKLETSARNILEAETLRQAGELKRLGARETTLAPELAARFFNIFLDEFWRTGEEARALHALARSEGLAR